jgi:hypothetical protein
MEDERSALIQPHPIDIKNTIQIQAYFATAFRAPEPSILLQILPKWRKFWIESRKNNKDDLQRLLKEPMTHGRKQDAFHFADATFSDIDRYESTMYCPHLSRSLISE